MLGTRVMAYYNEELSGVFAILAACARRRMRRFAGRREGPANKCPLPAGMVSEAEYWFNGMTHQSSQECSMVSCCLPYDSTNSKYRGILAINV